MEYHEALWVVIGTAAPVIALAAVVALGQFSLSPEKKRVTIGYGLVTIAAYLMLGASFLLAIAVFTFALDGLSNKADVWNRSTVGIMAIWSISLLFIATMLLQFRSLPWSKPRSRATPRKPPESQERRT